MTEDTRIANENIYKGLTSKRASVREKTAEDMTEYIEMRLWEDSLARGYMEFKQYTANDLDTQINIEEPVKLVAFAPHVPKAYSVPFSDEANALEFSGRRAAIYFAPITSSKFRKSKYLLMADPGDIRSYLTDKTKFELLDVVDVRVFDMIDAMVGDADDTTGASMVAQVDNPLHRTIYGTLTPETFVEVDNILPRSRDISGVAFHTQTMIMNRLLASKFKTWDAIDLPENMHEEIANKGWTRGSYQNTDLIITGKSHLVAENEIYTIAEKKHAGKAGMLDDITLFTDAEGQMIEWYAQWVPGVCLNPYAFGKATLAGI